MTFTDIISGIGAGLILLAFALSTFRILNQKSTIYFVLNFVGGIFALWGCVMISSVPFAILEGTWALVAAIGLIGAILKKPSNN